MSAKCGTVVSAFLRSTAGAMILMAIGSVVLVLLVYPWVQLRQPSGNSVETIRVRVAPGDSFARVAERLRESGLLRKGVPFVIGARVLGVDRRVRFGTYALNSNMSPWEILEILGEGRVLESRITVAEGADIVDIATLLEAAGISKAADFLDAARNPVLLESLGIKGKSAEGYCFPDTYRFPEGTPADFVLSAMVRRFRERLGNLLSHAPFPAGIRKPEDVITLASIVEREAQAPAERAVIAGVYLNRLRRGMKLEADPTAVYGLKRRGERITGEDIRRRNPYNTYQIKGLPPGPIANPGEAAVQAVLEPEGTDYLYFVARGDGTHEFSRTFRAHQRAVQRMGRMSR